MPTIRTVTATRYVTPLREGGSLPAIVEADDDGMYVVKFRGAGQGPRALIAELVTGEIGRALGLLVPEIVLVEIDPLLAKGEPDWEIQELLGRSAGLNLALDYLPGALAFDPVAKPAPGPGPAARIVWFDAFTTNVDRTPRNTNMLRWHGRLWLIDHGASLIFHHTWDAPERQAESPFARVKDHVLLPFAGPIPEVGAALLPLLTEPTLTEILAAVPDVWLTGEARFPDPDAHRAGYLDYFRRRLAAAERFTEEAERARVALVGPVAEYATIRVVPGWIATEFVNAGVVLFCRARRFLGARVGLGARREAALLALAPDLDLDGIRERLAAVPLICAGADGSGPIGALSQAERFHWLVAPASTVIQPSPVHPGMGSDPSARLDALYAALVGEG